MKHTSNQILEFTIIYNQYKGYIFNYVSKMLNDKTLCEDVVQTVFLKFYENVDFIRDKESTKSWLFTTARNEVFSIYRKKKVRKIVHPVEDEEEFRVNENSITEDYEMKEIKELLQIELDDLPDEQREVYLLKEYGQLSYKELSDTLGIDEGLVKSRLYKTRQKLINRLSKVLK
ncbi:rna polymerase sigma-70 factor, ecf subfamily [hydrocarbon metagenome]|uniref:Rna polymerase sigma-70 factor, ecf subfamily n=1 Tax=hydrocarbon metagenome TaxID=938273 RepID=A0A0W8FYG2_9ZZZZ